MIYEVSMVPAPGFCTLPARSSRKYKSLTMFQWFQHLAFVLWQSCQLESTNDLRSFNGSSTWLLYFGNPASSRVQMIYEASRGQALAVCTLAFSALLHRANTRRMPVHAPRQIRICRGNNSNYCRNSTCTKLCYALSDWILLLKHYT